MSFIRPLIGTHPQDETPHLTRSPTSLSGTASAKSVQGSELNLNDYNQIRQQRSVPLGYTNTKQSLIVPWTLIHLNNVYYLEENY